MLSRGAYERIIDSFLVEMNHLCLSVSEAELRALPGMNRAIDEAVADLRDPGRDPAQLLCLALAYLDEYTYADRERVLDAGYRAYRLLEDQVPRANEEPVA